MSNNYHDELLKEIYLLLEKYECKSPGIKVIEEKISEFQASGISVEEATKILEDKLLERIDQIKEKEEIESLKTTCFSKYVNKLLGRDLTLQECIEIISEFEISDEEKQNIISNLTEENCNQYIDSIQDIINKNMFYAEGYMFCKKKEMIRLNPFVAYNLIRDRVQIHVAEYDLRGYVKSHAATVLKGDTREERKASFNSFFKHYLEDALAKLSYVFEANPNYEMVSAISLLVESYMQIFKEVGMDIREVDNEEINRMFMIEKDIHLYEASMPRERLLEKYPCENSEIIRR